MFYLLSEYTVVPVTRWYSLLEIKNSYLADILISVICTVIKKLFSSFKCSPKENKPIYMLHIVTYRDIHIQREINA